MLRQSGEAIRRNQLPQIGELLHRGCQVIPCCRSSATAMVNTEFGERRYHRSMSEYPPSVPSAAHGPSGHPAAQTGFSGTGPGPSAWPSPSRAPSRWPTFLALALALVASGLAIVGWFRPSPSPPPRSATPTYTEQQVSDAKTRACTAFELVKTGTTLQAQGGEPNAQPSDDPAMRKAQSANARLSLTAGASYLLSHLDPGTPQPLADGIRKLSSTLMDIGIKYLAGAKNADPPQAALLSEGESDITNVAELCK